MAAAIARGWAAGDGGPDEMLFCDLARDRAEALAREVGGETRDRLGELRDDADVVVLAVKPAALEEVAGALDGAAPALISILAATPLARIAAAFPGVATLRVMPSQPVAVRAGVVCYVPPADPDSELSRRLVELLDPLGIAVAVDEPLIDAAMAVMSCSPAYVASFAEALAEAGIAEGLEPELASELVAATLAGTAELLRGRDPDSIRRAVAPPGGATEAGLVALEDGGFSAAVTSAVRASLERFR